MANSDSLTNTNNNNNDYHHENDPEMSLVEQLRQQMQQLHALETLINELRKSIVDTSLRESQNSVANTATLIMNIIQSYSETPDAVRHGRQMLKTIFELKMHTMIEPQNYEDSIRAYISWQNETIKYFVDEIWLKYSKNNDNTQISNNIEQAWNLNEESNEGIFLGGAARPLFSEKVTHFSDLLSSYYNKLDPLYVTNRSILFNVLYRLACEEGRKYWKNYDFFPSTTSTGVIEKCLHYFYFRDRNNTYFINSSGSDYIPFVHLAQQIFSDDKFVGSPMTDPADFNTEKILAKLIEQCTNICNKMNQSDPLIVILLTSKNRFGARIDVDKIHQKLVEKFPGKIVTLVDACQDGQAFQYVDIILYSKRFTATGAIALINKQLVKKHSRLKENMALGTSFPVSILAQLYININMINEGVAFGLEDLINSVNWDHYCSPVSKELQSAFNSYSQQENSTSSIKITKNNVQFEFTEDESGTIVMITMPNRDKNDESLSRLMSKLKKQGHTLDSFLMNDPFDRSSNRIKIEEVEELIKDKKLLQLRAVEARCSTHLAWPLVPFSVMKDDLISEEHFNRCQSYHRCLRISVDRSGHPGKLKRFVDIVQAILGTNQVAGAIVEPTDFQNYRSQWPSTE